MTLPKPSKLRKGNILKGVGIGIVLIIIAYFVLMYFVSCAYLMDLILVAGVTGNLSQWNSLYCPYTVEIWIGISTEGKHDPQTVRDLAWNMIT